MADRGRLCPASRCRPSLSIGPPKEQARGFARQVLPPGQRQAEFLCREPGDPPLEPANLDRLYLSPATLGLELDLPLHDRPHPTERDHRPGAAPCRPVFSTASGMGSADGGVGCRVHLLSACGVTRRAPG